METNIAGCDIKNLSTQLWCFLWELLRLGCRKLARNCVSVNRDWASLVWPATRQTQQTLDFGPNTAWQLEQRWIPMNWCVSAFSLPDSATAKWAKLKPKSSSVSLLQQALNSVQLLCHIRSYLSQLPTWNLTSGSVVSVVWLRHPSLRERRETQINSYKCRFWKRLDASLPWIPEWDQWDFQNLWNEQTL